MFGNVRPEIVLRSDFKNLGRTKNNAVSGRANATLRVAGFTYTLEQVLVTGCAATPGNSGAEPTQSISLNYLHRKLNKL